MGKTEIVSMLTCILYSLCWFKHRHHRRVHAWIGQELNVRPSIDFDAAFFTIAVKEGCSELIHIDFNDHPHSITWVFAVGEWEGGELCLPQLGKKFPIRPRQLFGIMSRVLAHCSAPVTAGRRVIFTCFSDCYILEHTDLPVYGN